MSRDWAPHLPLCLMLYALEHLELLHTHTNLKLTSYCSGGPTCVACGICLFIYVKPLHEFPVQRLVTTCRV